MRAQPELYLTHEIAGIFLIKSIRNPTSSFNINNYITFYTGSPQLAKALKLQHFSEQTIPPDIHTSIEFVAYAMPYQINTIKKQLRAFLFNHFITTLILPTCILSIFYVHVPDVNRYPDLKTSMTYNLCT